MTEQDCSDLTLFLGDTRYRRSWLLIKASHCETLDRALDLAKRCDDFITGAAAGRSLGQALVQGGLSDLQGSQQQTQISPMPSGVSDEAATPKATRSGISEPERERLLSRLAEGAKNAELAVEFGLSLKQVQGIRMGCAREIRRRREKQTPEGETSKAATITASIHDVIRYLRQQDDVVVPQERGDFLVNARFRLPVADLLTRANRMRVRQGKPPFQLNGHAPTCCAASSATCSLADTLSH